MWDLVLCRQRGVRRGGGVGWGRALTEGERERDRGRGRSPEWKIEVSGRGGKK